MNDGPISNFRRRLTVAAGACVLAMATSVASAQDVTIAFWNNWDGNRADQLRSVLDDFEAAHPGIKVDNVTLTSSTTTQRMLAAVASGAVPDLYMLNTNDVTQWATLGAMLPLNDYVEKDGLDLDEVFISSSIEGSTYGEDLIQLPFKIPTSLAVWYNRELFEEAGLDPDNPPSTWQELEEAAVKLTKRDGDVISQLGLNICPNCASAAELAFNELLSRNGGKLLSDDATDVAFDSPEGLQTLQWMVDFSENTAGGWNNVVAQYGNTFTDMRPSFYAGKVAMMLDGPWLYNIARAESPDILDKVDVFVLPANGDNPDAEERYVAYGVPGYGIPKDSEHPDEAWELLKFVAAEMDGACKFFEMQNRPDSPIRTCRVNVDDRVADELNENLNLVQAAIAPSHFPQINKRLQEMQESVLLGNETPEDGLAAAAADVRSIIGVD